MRYVILLRGVNVGGHHRVPKVEFKAVLEQLGCSDVTIYLNSGNAVCTSDTVLESVSVQLALEKHFGFTIPTLVLLASRFQSIAEAIPAHWTNDTPKPEKSGQKSDVLYLFDAVNRPDVLDAIGYKPAIETMLYVDGAIIANVLRVNQLKGSLQKLVGTKLYAQMTIRNVNTTRALADLLKT